MACILDLVTGNCSEQIEASSSLKADNWGVRPVGWPAMIVKWPDYDYLIRDYEIARSEMG